MGGCEGNWQGVKMCEGAWESSKVSADVVHFRTYILLLLLVFLYQNIP